ncbi:MAG: DUF2878 domain-containing protein [Pseudomonadota bacterium]
MAFKLTWTACVYGAVSGWPWAGPLAAVAIIAVHLAFAFDRFEELKLIVLCGLLGAALESALIQSGLVSYFGQPIIPGSDLPPLWLLAMWFGFATLLNVSFRFLHHRLIIAAVLGLAVGPLTYLGGENLGGITFTGDRNLALGAIAILWAVVMPLLCWVARQWDGYAPAGTSSIEPAGSKL